MTDDKAKRFLVAARNVDWDQHVMNRGFGPPCFFLPKDENEFCGRAKEWDGHKTFGSVPPLHNFTPLHTSVESYLE